MVAVRGTQTGGWALRGLVLKRRARKVGHSDNCGENQRQVQKENREVRVCASGILQYLSGADHVVRSDALSG